MSNRVLVIINENVKFSENVKGLLAVNSQYGTFKEVYVFTKSNEDFDSQTVRQIDVHTIKIPEIEDTRPKVKNFVIRHFKSIGYSGKLHVIEERIDILKDPTQFVSDIENMMDVLDMNTWCGTVTDTCNYIYKKYNPRVDVQIDDERFKGIGLTDVLFCSHANVHWMVFDMQKAMDNELYFNETFTIDMFFIIEYLARRRNSYPESLYFMNQYVSCKSEYGVYTMIKDDSPDLASDKELMQKEDALFRSMQIDFSPTNNIDLVLERLYEKLKTKI